MAGGASDYPTGVLFLWFAVHTQQASGAHAKLGFFIWSFEPDVSGWWFLFFSFFVSVRVQS